MKEKCPVSPPPKAKWCSNKDSLSHLSNLFQRKPRVAVAAKRGKICKIYRCKVLRGSNLTRMGSLLMCFLKVGFLGIRLSRTRTLRSSRSEKICPRGKLYSNNLKSTICKWAVFALSNLWKSLGHTCYIHPSISQMPITQESRSLELAKELIK